MVDVDFSPRPQTALRPGWYSRRRLLLGLLASALTAACAEPPPPIPTASPSPQPSPIPSPSPRTGPPLIVPSPSPSPVPALGRPGLLTVERDGRILLVDPERQQPVKTLVGSPDNAAPRWSPDGRSILFVQGIGPAAELRLISAGDGIERRLTSNSRPERGAVWSPRGDQIAYTLPRAVGPGGADDPGSPEEVWLLDVQTGTDRKLVDGFDPAWSPDGRRLAYASNGERNERGPGNNAIRVVGADGQGDRQVLAMSDLPPDLLPTYGLPFSPGTLRLRAPAWSPDGQRIVASADGHTSMALTFDERGQGLRPWALAYEGGVGIARWSPDGSRLAIESQPATGVDVVVVVDLANQHEVPIGGPSVGFKAFGPTWAPDGRRLAVVVGKPPGRRDDPPESALRLFDLAGAALSDLIAEPGLEQPDWGRAP